MKNILKKVTAIVLTLATLLTLCSCGAIGSTKVDLKDYITIEFEGYSGEAECDISVDYDGLNALVDAEQRNKNVRKLIEKNGIKSGDYLFNSLSIIESWFTVELTEDYENISNGDMLKFEVVINKSLANQFGLTLEDVEKQLGLNFDATEFEIQASGIKEYTMVDVFAAVKEYIVFDDFDISGEGYPNIELPDDFEVTIDGLTIKKAEEYTYADLTFYVDNKRQGNMDFLCENPVTSGENYEMKLEFDGYCEDNLKYYGYKVTSLSMAYTAPTLSKRISSTTELSAKEIQQIKNEIATQCTAEHEKVLEVKYLYLGTRKAGSEQYRSNVVLAAVNVEDWVFGSRGVYVWVDVVRTPEGKIAVDAYSYKFATVGLEEKVNNDPDYTFQSLL